MRNLRFMTSLIVSCVFVGFACTSKENPKFSSADSSISIPGSSKKLAQALTININQDPQSLDPRKARVLNDVNIVKMLMDGLMRTSFDGEVTLALANKVTASEDQLTYTISLKPSKWSNGATVTAHDFIYSWKKALSPSFPSDNASLLYAIKNGALVKQGRIPASMLGLHILDETTFVVELERPTPYFLELLTNPVFFAVHAETDKENPDWALSPETYVGCGPFKLSSWKHADSLEVVKNDKYWDAGSVRLKKISMVMVTPETGLSMYQNQELDWEGSPLSTLPLDSIPTLNKEGKLKNQDILATTFIRTNVLSAPFNSPSVRKAFALTINKEALIDHVLFGNADYASGIVPNILGSKQKESYDEASIAKAKDLLSQAIANKEISKENLNKIKLSFLSSHKNSRICQAIQEDWKNNLGIDVELEPLEANVYFSKVSHQDFQLSLGSWFADFRDPINFLEIFKTKDVGTNNTNWENHDYYAKLENSYTLKNPEERKEALQECEKILMEEMPVIPIWHGKLQYVRNDKVKNVVLSETGGIDFKWAYLERR